MSNLLKIAVIQIAAAAHAVNAAYCLSLGDDTQKPWGEAPDWQKESAIKGVEFILENPDAPVSATHDSWTEQKLADGWIYGETKDEEVKTHPCLVPFEELPLEQKAKDHLFAAVVRSLSAIEIEAPVQKVAPAVKKSTEQPVTIGLTSIKYIGIRDEYTDGAYGTRITFKRNESKLVPSDKAVLMLKHKDVYAEGDSKGAEVATLNASPKVNESEEELQNARDAVANMDLEALKVYATTNFSGHKLHHNLSLESARSKVIGLIDQFGVV
jgi:hypothetical protein